MEFKLITFEETRELINKALNFESSQQYELTPNGIYSLFEKFGIIPKRKRIPKWNDFESGNKELTIEKVLEETKIQLNTEKPIVIVSDECFKDQKAYKIPANRLKAFAEKTYPKLHNMELVQPFDLIFIQPSTKSITMLHHEGIIFEY